MTTDASTTIKSIALVGARGYTGAELISIISRHPLFNLTFASSRELSGERVADHLDSFEGDLVFTESSPLALIENGADVIILALPNGASAEYVEVIETWGRGPDSIIIDLSADHRFDDSWTYGLTEHFRDAIRTATRISNPGCYATAIQLALRPVLRALDGPPTIFGVSGYSGAGTAPSERNDPKALCGNLIPYQLTGHGHAREAARHLGHPVRFHPHVAEFFRGITITVSMTIQDPFDQPSLDALYSEAYLDEPLIKYATQIPYVSDTALHPYCMIGGLTVDENDPHHAAVVATIDNLLKGAATQAIQNANLACGFNEYCGIDRSEVSP